MDQELQVHQALLRQAEAAAHMQTLMQSQLGLPAFAGFGLPTDLQAQLQAHIQALSSGQVANESQSPPAGMGPPKTSSPVNGNGSQTNLLAMAGRNTPTSFGKQRHLSNANSPRRSKENNGMKEDEQDSIDGSTSPSPPASMLASIAAAASALRSPNGGLLPPASAGAHPYLASAFSGALGNLSALTSGLNGSGTSGQQQQQPPLTPSPSSDSPQHNTEVPRAVNSSQQSWTFEEQFKQVPLFGMSTCSSLFLFSYCSLGGDAL